jgi:lactate/malate dehydrogenase, NAD binding domain
MLLKMNKLVTELALYDVANVKGVAADLSHCNTPVKVCRAPRLHAPPRYACFNAHVTTSATCTQIAGYLGPDELAGALTGAQLVGTRITVACGCHRDVSVPARA